MRTKHGHFYKKFKMQLIGRTKHGHISIKIKKEVNHAY